MCVCYCYTYTCTYQQSFVNATTTGIFLEILFLFLVIFEPPTLYWWWWFFFVVVALHIDKKQKNLGIAASIIFHSSDSILSFEYLPSIGSCVCVFCFSIFLFCFVILFFLVFFIVYKKKRLWQLGIFFCLFLFIYIG